MQPEWSQGGRALGLDGLPYGVSGNIKHSTHTAFLGAKKELRRTQWSVKVSNALASTWQETHGATTKTSPAPASPLRATSLFQNLPREKERKKERGVSRTLSSTSVFELQHLELFCRRGCRDAATQTWLVGKTTCKVGVLPSGAKGEEALHSERQQFKCAGCQHAHAVRQVSLSGGPTDPHGAMCVATEATGHLARTQGLPEIRALSESHTLGCLSCFSHMQPAYSTVQAHRRGLVCEGSWQLWR